MPAFPDTRFARIRLTAAEHPAATLTFVAANPSQPPSAENNGVLAEVAARSPDAAAKVTAELASLLLREDEIFEWIEADPLHGLAFARDPVAAIGAALPDLPKDFFSGWSGAW